jgi:hypothetical protein
MAFAHRGEVGILKHEQAIAESELDLVKTKRIPWFSFVDAAYAQDSTSGQHTNDNYGVQVGVILPLFSWLAKDEKVVEARIEGYYASLEANQKKIANEVAEAFQSVKEASRHRARTEAAIEQHSRLMKERAKDLEASEDLAAREQLRYETEMELYKFHDYNLAADRLYNQSLLRLERALGADLDQVFEVEFESSYSSLPAGEKKTAGPAISSAAKPDLIRAKPVPEASARTLPDKLEEPARRGFLGFLKEQGSRGDASPDPDSGGQPNRNR